MIYYTLIGLVWLVYILHTKRFEDGEMDLYVWYDHIFIYAMVVAMWPICIYYIFKEVEDKLEKIAEALKSIGEEMKMRREVDKHGKN